MHVQVFDMFGQISLPAGEAGGCPPGILPPGWRSAYQARQRTAQVVLNLAKAAPQVQSPPQQLQSLNHTRPSLSVVREVSCSHVC